MSSDSSWQKAWVESWKVEYPCLVKFPDLLHCLLGYFPEADIEGLTDEQAAKQCIKELDPNVRLSTIEQGNKLLSEVEFPWQEVGRAANRYFESDSAAKDWLRRMLSAAEESI